MLANVICFTERSESIDVVVNGGPSEASLVLLANVFQSRAKRVMLLMLTIVGEGRQNAESGLRLLMLTKAPEMLKASITHVSFPSEASLLMHTFVNVIIPERSESIVN